MCCQVQRLASYAVIAAALTLVSVPVVNGAPAATLTGAVSRKNCDVTMTSGILVEPRQGGVTELRLTFDAAPGDPSAGSLTMEQSSCVAPGYAPYSGASALAAQVVGSDLVLSFSPGLENAHTYRLILAPAVTSIAGQFVEVSVLAGDTQGDGRVNAADRGAVVGLWTGARFSCPADLNSDGEINATDRSIVVGAWTSGQNCAPSVSSPVATLHEVTGVEDQVTLIQLSAAVPGDPDADIVFTITALPAAGELQQVDGTPIQSSPAEVTDPDGNLRYVPVLHACSWDQAVATFGYTATDSGSGLTSPPGSASVFLTPVYDPVAWPGWPGPGIPSVEGAEDTPLYIQLPPSPEGRYYITETFDDFGVFFQVQDDNVTAGPMILADAGIIPVTNVANWILFVPNSNRHGNTVGFFSFTHTPDHWPDLPIFANDLRVDVDIVPVNDPPVAYPVTFTQPNYRVFVPGSLQFNDLADTLAVGHLTITFTRFPQAGRLYAQAGNWQPNEQPAPEQEITPERSVVNGYVRDFLYFRDATSASYLYESGCPFDDFAYTVTDGEYTTDETVVTLCIDMMNLPPEMDPEWEPIVMLEEDGQATTRFTPTDDGGFAQIFVLPVSLPQHGMLYYLMPVFGGGVELRPVPLNDPLPVPLASELEWWELRYVPDPDFNTHESSPDTWSFQIYDSFDHFTPDLSQPIGFWGEYERQTFTYELHVSPVNDAPVITAPSTVTARMLEPFVIGDISVADDAPTDAVLTATLFCTAGMTIALVDPGELTVITTGSALVVVEGTLQQFAGALDIEATTLSPADQLLFIQVEDHGAGGANEPAPLMTTRTITVDSNQ